MFDYIESGYCVVVKFYSVAAIFPPFAPVLIFTIERVYSENGVVAKDGKDYEFFTEIDIK